MSTNSVEKELLAAIWSTLNGDTELKTSTGINPGTGAARAVAIYNQPVENAPVPYVRFTIDSTRNVEGEPFEYSYTPSAKAVGFMLDVFSDYEPEVLAISTRLQALLQHKEITTTHFHGSTWLTNVVYFVDNLSNPDRLYRRANLRLIATIA